MKTIRQIIRESVRNMSLPPLSMGEDDDDSTSGPGHRKPEVPRRAESTRLSGNGNGHESSGGETIQMCAKFRSLTLSFVSGSTRTLTNARKRPNAKQFFNSLQRHSSGNIDYDNVEKCGNPELSGNKGASPGSHHVRARSRTMGDGIGEFE